MACSLPGFSVHGIFQVLNLGLPHCRQMLYRLSHQGSPEDSQRERKMKERERETFPAKSSNLRRCPARSQHKGLREYQRRASRLQTGPAHPSPETGRQAANSQSQRERGKLAPELASSTKLRAGSLLLSKSSWDPGRLPSGGRVAARDHVPRGDTRHA